jgi:hypothetical protein
LEEHQAVQAELAGVREQLAAAPKQEDIMALQATIDALRHELNDMMQQRDAKVRTTI